MPQRFYAQPLDVQEVFSKSTTVNGKVRKAGVLICRKTLWSVDNPNENNVVITLRTTIDFTSGRTSAPKIERYISRNGWQQVYSIIGEKRKELKKDNDFDGAERELLRLYYLVSGAEPNCEVVTTPLDEPERALDENDSVDLQRFAAMDTDL